MSEGPQLYVQYSQPKEDTPPFEWKGYTLKLVLEQNLLYQRGLDLSKWVLWVCIAQEITKLRASNFEDARVGYDSNLDPLWHIFSYLQLWWPITLQLFELQELIVSLWKALKPQGSFLQITQMSSNSQMNLYLEDYLRT